MHITIHGGSKQQRQITRTCLDWVKKILLPKYKNIEILVTIKKLRRETVDGILMANFGYLEYDDIKAREFQIVLDSGQNQIDFIKTILHEFVHIKQFILEEMVEKHPKHSGPLTYWKGRNYSGHQYNDQPWEKEATRLEEILYKQFINQ